VNDRIAIKVVSGRRLEPVPPSRGPEKGL